MIRWIVGSSLKSRLPVVVLAAALLFFGVTQLRNLPVDVLPEFSPPTVEIQTEALGLSAEEVEQLITVPMEQDLLNGVAFLDTIRSESIPGLSRIEMVFEPGTDLLRARQVVQERLIQAQGPAALPNVSSPPQMLQPLSSTSRVMMIGLRSERLSLIDMSVLARWTIKPRLLGVPGVANVAVWGQRERQLQVHADPERLRERGVTLNQVVETAGNALWVSPLSFLEASTPGTGGFIDTPNQRIGIQHVLPISSPDELAQVSLEGVKRVNGETLRLADVATVVEDHQPLIGDAVLGDGPGLLLVVEKFPNANTMEVTEEVEAALDALAPGLAGIQIDSTLFRPATFIETGLGNLRTALLLGALLLLVVLAGLLLQWRSVAVSGATVLLSLLAALAVLWLRDATVNAMVLAGLVMALGAIVDDAVTGVDNVARRLRERRDRAGGAAGAPGAPGDQAAEPASGTILRAVAEVRGPLAYATLIILVIVVPVFFMEGLAGAFFPPLALSYVLAVLASLLVALVVTPALALLLLPGARAERRQPPLARWAEAGYQRLLAPLVAAPRRALLAGAAGLVVVLVGAALLPFLSQSLAPSFKDTDLLVRLDAPAGTSHPEMTRVTAQASRELRAIPGVRDVGAHVGRAITSDQVVGVNSSELWVGVDPGADYDRTLSSIRRVVDSYPGLAGAVLTYPTQRIDEVLTGAGDAVVVRVYGQDLDVLRGKAEEVRRLLAGIDGTVDERVERLVEEPTLEIEVDLAAAQRNAIKPGDVRRAAATLLSGIQVGSLFETQKVFDVVVWGAPEVRRSLSDIRDLPIDVPGGGRVRLDDVADLRIRPTPSAIRHDATARSIDVSAAVRGRDPDAVAGEVQRRLGEVQFPLEHHAELLGDYAERQAANRRALIFAGIAALAVFLLLQAAFGSWRLAAAVFVALPMALVGGVIAALVSGGVVSIGTAAGLVLVLGVAARGAVLLVGRSQQLEREGERFGPALVLRAARERLAPTVTTALATALALVPLLFIGNVAGLEILQPMAVVAAGGLVTATLLNLFVTPALYLRFGSGAERRLDATP